MVLVSIWQVFYRTFLQLVSMIVTCQALDTTHTDEIHYSEFLAARAIRVLDVTLV